MSAQSPQNVLIRVPASTSNLGSGFDTLGLALAIYNEIRVTRGGSRDAREDPFIAEVANHFFRATGRPPEPIGVEIDGDVPRSRGLGSSVTVRCGIYAGMNKLWRTGLSRFEIAQAVTELEGHPDNAVASLFGGLTIAKLAVKSHALEDYLSCPVEEDLLFVVISPDQEVKTNDSRTLLPPSLPFGDAVQSLNSLSFFLAAMLRGESARLTGLSRFEGLHEPWRLAHQPGADEALAAARSSGARAAWLSGSGSSLVALTTREEAPAIREALQKPFRKIGVSYQLFTTTADHEGLQIISS